MLNDLTRFVQFACSLGLFGTAAWQQVRVCSGLEPESEGQGEGWPLAVYAAGCLLCAVATIGWLFAEANAIGDAWSVVGAVIASTHFGQVAAIRATLLLISAAVAWWGRRSRGLWVVLGALAAAAVVSFVWTGHGTAGVGALGGLHIITDALHLLCASLWIGALIMLSAGAVHAVAVRTQNSSAALLVALSRFSAVGPALIGLLVATGFINTWLLAGPGHWRELLRQPYGWALIAKLTLFAGMLALGWQHRNRATPALRRALASSQNSGSTLRSLRKTLLTETSLALLILAAVAVLGNLEPPASLS